LQALHSVGLRAHPEKSIFGADCIEYLGHNISEYGLQPNQTKVEAVTNLRSPTNVSELRTVMGFINYYRCYVPNFASIARPLNDLFKKGKRWEWTEECKAAYQQLKDSIITPGKALKRLDPDRDIILHTDWSNRGIGAVMGQKDQDGKEYICACISRSLNQHESNYSSPEGEMLAAVWAIKSLRPYLHGRRFTLVTDHSALLQLFKKTDLTGKYARWALALQDYEFEIVHRPGITHQNADPLSRMPQASSEDTTGARLDHDLPAAVNAMSHRPGRMGRAGVSHVFAALAIAVPGGGGADSPNSSSADPFWLDPLEEANQATNLDLFMRRPAEQQDTPAATHQPSPENHLTSPPTSAWVKQAAWPFLDKPAATVLLGGQRGPRDMHGVASSHSITTKPIPAFFNHCKDGIVMLELFGGLSAGLEMALRNNIPIKKYLFVDKDPIVQRLARWRVQQLHKRYPGLLPQSAIDNFLSLPQDVYSLHTNHLVQHGARAGDQWLVVAGWECQDLSPAGSGRGIDGAHSSSLMPLVRILGALQQLQHQRPPGYLVENTAFQMNFNSSKVSGDDFDRVTCMIGTPITCDAARFGSYAHRLRHYWQNLADPNLLQQVVNQVKRDPDRLVRHILDSNRTCHPVESNQKAPGMYWCNTPGEPRRCLPTLMAARKSYSFHEGKSGSIYDHQLRRETQPNPDERERALGYPTGTTACPGLTSAQRHAITGRCMDANAMQGIFAICQALAPLRIDDQPTIPTQRIASEAQLRSNYGNLAVGFLQQHGWQPGTGLRPSGIPAPIAPPATSQRRGLGYRPMARAVSALNATAPHDSPSDKQPAPEVMDIHQDPATMEFLRTGNLPVNASAAETKRIRQRARSYVIDKGKVYKLDPNKKSPTGSSRRLVPPPEDRELIIKQTHEHSGHFGEKRTISLLQLSYWWRSLNQDTITVVRSCTTCSQVKATFNAQSPHLQPLPISGYLYRWHVDLMGPFERSNLGNTYVMICIEAFTKWAEVIPIPSKQAEQTRQAFLLHVLSRYSAPAEVVTDQGKEWQGVFAALLEDSFIDHRTTSAYHPPANGLAERCVQTMKMALKKYCESGRDRNCWDEHLPFMAMGYRCSKQSSTRLSPYEMLFADTPIIPPAARDRFSENINLDDPQAAADHVLRHATLIRDHMPMAGRNLMIAQHRDTLRYATVRGGGYTPRLQRFHVGDFVYVKNQQQTNFTAIARSQVLRVVEVRNDSVMVLQGKCGAFRYEHVTNCAPCHLSNIDPTIDYTLQRPAGTLACQKCNFISQYEDMLLCDACGTGWHLDCLTPVLSKPPPGRWTCPTCRGAPAPGPPATTPPGGAATTSKITTTRQLRSKLASMYDGRKVRRIADINHVYVCRYSTVSHISSAWDGSPAFAVSDVGSADHPTVMSLQQLEPLLHDQPGPLLYAEALPDYWDLWDQGVLADAMHTLMPGMQPPPLVAKLAVELASKLRKPEYIPFRPTAPEEAHPLLHVLNLQGHTVLDPWAGDGTLANVVRPYAGMVISNDFNPCHINDLRMDALQPSTYRIVAALQTHRQPYSAIVTAPWLTVADIAVPLAAVFSPAVACLLLPGNYVTNAPPARHQWLARLLAAGRLHLVVGMPQRASTVNYIWLLIFKTAAMKADFIKPPYLHDGSLSIVAA
jgi:hypothetical protein